MKPAWFAFSTSDLTTREASLTALFTVFYAIVSVFVWYFGSGVLQVSLLIVAPCLAWTTAKDILSFEIPDFSLLVLAITALIAMALGDWQALSWRFFAAGLVLMALWGIGEWFSRVQGREGLGIGDAKLIAVATLWIGAHNLPVFLFLSSTTALLFIGIAKLIFNRSVKKHFAFGPYLSFWLLILIVLDINVPILVSF